MGLWDKTINPLNAELNPICHLLALAHHIFHVSGLGIKESPGLYYDHIGEAQLHNTEWKLLTYIDLQEADQNLETVKKYAQLSMEFCNRHEHTYWSILQTARKSPVT